MPFPIRKRDHGVASILPPPLLTSALPPLSHFLDDDTTGHMQKMRAQVGSFCLVTRGIFIVAEILSLYAGFKYSCRCGPDNILVLLIGGIPIAVLAVLSITLGVAAPQLAKHKTIVTRITAFEELAGVTIADDLIYGTLQLLPQTTTSSSLLTPPHGGRCGRLSPAGVWDPTQRASSYWAEYTSRVRQRAPFPIATAPPTGTSRQPPTSPTPSAAVTGKRKAPSPTSPSSPTLPTSSKLPRFFQSRLTATAQSRSQLTARPAASSSASHATSASTT
ncbi:hypothetical protein C8J57DRAFT_1533122 [Mycena rebaudengoi]|nr:hypothetical protein C8J57DRAFT_1533122 [Mycena rebaudengoi]